jgi:hypothetical protein
VGFGKPTHGLLASFAEIGGNARLRLDLVGVRKHGIRVATQEIILLFGKKLKQSAVGLKFGAEVLDKDFPIGMHRF